MPDAASPTIPPGATIGVIGGGQLGRMLAFAAHRMGYHVHVLDPTPRCPAAQAADDHSLAHYEDADAALRFAQAVDVVTFEFENVPALTLDAIAALRPVRPSPFVLKTCRHRAEEKRFLDGLGVAVAPFRVCESIEEVDAAVAAVGLPSILKTTQFGYDGKGQCRLQRRADAAEAWAAVEAGFRSLGGTDENRVPPQAVLEAVVPFDLEVSVVCARGVDGAFAHYGTVRNEHADHILDVTTAPAPGVSATVTQRAVDTARRIAEALGLVGVLAVEFFVVGEDLIVNELAPRPHNSGHFTLDACVTSQFEQQLRAVCGLPLGDPTQRRPAAMANLLGEQARVADWSSLLAQPDAHLHLYGKADARPGRKMGHITALATASPPDTPRGTRDDAEATRRRVLRLRESIAAAR